MLLECHNSAHPRFDSLAEKPCTKCHAVKALVDFPGNRTKRDGRDSECRACRTLRRSAKKTTKVCSSCQQRKPFEQFTRNREKRDGYDNRCKECRKAHDKARPAGQAPRHQERKALYRRQSLFTVTLRRPTTKAPTKIDVRFWNRISDPTERDRAHQEYLKLLAPPQCGGRTCVCGKCIGDPYEAVRRA